MENFTDVLDVSDGLIKSAVRSSRDDSYFDSQLEERSVKKCQVQGVC